MPAQYPGIGFPPSSEVGLLRRLVNNTALIAENGGGGGGGGISWVSAPASSGAAGTAGSVAYDSEYFYVAVANATWRRVPISDW
jgi:hypothetical protein